MINQYISISFHNCPMRFFFSLLNNTAWNVSDCVCQNESDGFVREVDPVPGIGSADLTYFIGLSLAVGSSLFIGSSFIVKKRSLIRLAEVSNFQINNF